MQTSQSVRLGPMYTSSILLQLYISTSWVVRRCPGLYSVKILNICPQGALPESITPPRPESGSPQPTCKDSYLYLENCATALRQTDRQTDRQTETILYIDIDSQPAIVILIVDYMTQTDEKSLSDWAILAITQ